MKVSEESTKQMEPHEQMRKEFQELFEKYVKGIKKRLEAVSQQKPLTSLNDK